MPDTELSLPFVSSALRRAGLERWIPEGEGKGSLPIQFLPDGAGWVELMRVEPGVRIGLHRHGGEVHALNLQGRRRLSDGRTIGPGDYVFEPAGNVDWWQAIGDEPLIVHVVVKGDVEYVKADGSVTRRITVADRIDDYERHCRAAGVSPRNLAAA